MRGPSPISIVMTDLEAYRRLQRAHAEMIKGQVDILLGTSVGTDTEQIVAEWKRKLEGDHAAGSVVIGVDRMAEGKGRDGDTHPPDRRP